MKIKANASTEELSSPFFKSNREYCSTFEHFVANKKGEVKGSFNAWSYQIYGKISYPNKWMLKYKKSIFTTSGNLLFSSKDQCVFVLAEWNTEIIKNQYSDFTIRRKNKTDFLRKLLNSSISELDISNKYILEIKNEQSKLLFKLKDILKPLFLTGEIYLIQFNNSHLKIEMRTEKHHFKTLDKLITELHS